MEMLIDFKVSYGKTLKTVAQMLEKFRPDMDLERREAFIYSFFRLCSGFIHIRW